MVNVIDVIQLRIEVINKAANTAIKKTEQSLGQLGKISKKIGSMMMTLQNSILGVGFGLLFIGMAIKAFAQKIMTSLVTAFVTARDEGDFLANKVLGVSAAFEFLKFAIFDAFANSDLFIPIIEGIINITNAISQFIAKRPALATFLVIFAGIAVVVGGLMMFFGQIALSVLAMISAFQILQPIVAALAGVSLLAVVKVILIIIAIVAVLAAVWMTNFGNIRDFVSSTFGIIWKTISGVVKNLVEIFKGLFMIIEGLFTGDFSKVWEGVVTIVFNAITGILKLVTGLGTAIVNIFIFVVNVIKDSFFNITKLVLGAVEALINAANKIPGINISTNILSNAQDYLSDLQQKVTIPSISEERVGQSFENLEAIKDIIIDTLTERDERRAEEKQTVVNVNVEGNVLGEEDFMNRVLKNISDSNLGSPNGG